MMIKLPIVGNTALNTMLLMLFAFGTSMITAVLGHHIREELEYIPSWLHLYQILLLIILRECLHQMQ